MRDKMILDNLGLIHRAMKDLHCDFTDKDNIEEIYYHGLLGLIKAVDSYDKDKSTSTYLYVCIANSIKGYFKAKTMQKRYSKLKDISLDQPYQNNDIYLIDILPSDENIEENYMKKDTQERVRKVLNKLKNKLEMKCLCEYYGIDSKAQNYRQMARKYGVSYQCIQQRVKRGLKNIKKELEKEFKDEKKNNEI